MHQLGKSVHFCNVRYIQLNIHPPLCSLLREIDVRASSFNQDKKLN